jgi:ribosomal protein L17
VAAVAEVLTTLLAQMVVQLVVVQPIVPKLHRVQSLQRLHYKEIMAVGKTQAVLAVAAVAVQVLQAQMAVRTLVATVAQGKQTTSPELTSHMPAVVVAVAIATPLELAVLAAVETEAVGEMRFQRKELTD